MVGAMWSWQLSTKELLATCDLARLLLERKSCTSDLIRSLVHGVERILVDVAEAAQETEGEAEVGAEEGNLEAE